jgi:hypothetical protein
MKTGHSGNSTRRAFVGVGAVVAVGALSGCLGRGFGFGNEVSESTTESFAPKDVRSVEVQNAIGHVTVRGAETDAVEVQIVKQSSAGQQGLDDIDVSTTLTDGVLRVVTNIDARSAVVLNGESPNTAVTITVPAGSAGPAITAVDCDLGEVLLLNTHGDTVVRTDLGRIVATGVDGYLSLTSDMGNIEAADVTGLDNVYTEMGKIKVDLLGLRGDVDIGTEMGEVVVGVADDLDLDVLAEAGGRVSSDLTLSDLRSERQSVSGRLNRGGSQVHAFSDMGEVDLRAIRR